MHKGRRHLGVFLAVSLILLSPVDSKAQPPKTITGKDGAEMVIIPEGTFIMGTTAPDIKEVAPQTEVYLDSFYMDKYEVTNEKFAKFLNDASPPLAERLSWVVLRSDLDIEERETWWPTEIILEKGGYTAFPGFEKHPVQSLSWFAANSYCRWAGKKLPTEAQWEKAARGGLEKKDFPWGDEIPTGGVIYNRVWRDNHEPPPTEPVGNYYPNNYGLYDMAGNVWEWCSDWYAPDYYKNAPNENPKGPEDGTAKVLRGGSWFNSAQVLRAAFRNASNPYSTDDAVGFRCAMDLQSSYKLK